MTGPARNCRDRRGLSYAEVAVLVPAGHRLLGRMGRARQGPRQPARRAEPGVLHGGHSADHDGARAVSWLAVGRATRCVPQPTPSPAGALVGLGNLAYYQALAAGAKVATAVALTALYPIVTVVLALILLGEKPRPGQWLGVAGSLAAIYLLNVRRPVEGPAAWSASALTPVALWGLAALVMKISTRDASAERATFWFLAAFVPLGLAIVAIGPVRWALPARDWFLITLLGADLAWCLGKNLAPADRIPPRRQGVRGDAAFRPVSGCDHSARNRLLRGTSGHPGVGGDRPWHRGPAPGAIALREAPDGAELN